MKTLFIGLLTITITTQLTAAHNEDGLCPLSAPELNLDLTQLSTWQRLFTPSTDLEQETKRWDDVGRLCVAVDPWYTEYMHLKDKLWVENSTLYAKVDQQRLSSHFETPQGKEWLATRSPNVAAVWIKLLIKVREKISEAEVERTDTLKIFAQGEQTKNRFFDLLKAEKFQVPTKLFSNLTFSIADSGVLTAKSTGCKPFKG